ncbi:WYL domain-containing protein [Priestia megaterium]|uniref:WYL domain-containing protein n=1 Tax=Priestia megaterium TaxID=1404 RepID=UPI00221F0FAD|nr:WYL domain-containing protein [Priestia megaterium]
MLRLLQESCVSKRPIEVIYMADNGSVTQRSIIVNEIDGKAIKVWCLLRNEKRTFKLNNILSCGFKDIRKRGLAQ